LVQPHDDDRVAFCSGFDTPGASLIEFGVELRRHVRVDMDVPAASRGMERSSEPMNPKQACPNCQDTPVRRIFQIGPGNAVVECTACRLQFAEAYPSFAQADSEIYDDRYFAETLEKRPLRRRVFYQLLVELESVAGRTGRLLDVGAGEGTLIQSALERGWEAEGTELSSAMVRHARDELGLTVHHGVLENITLPADTYDAIILNHVLEHVKNPRTTLQRVAELLHPRGVVRVEVPNLASFSSRLKKGQSRLKLKKNPWKHYATGHHFWYFTPATLKRTLEAAGLSVIVLSAPARQWGDKHPFIQLANRICRNTRWGGHIAAYACRGTSR
jgi:2-polyprenyl-3-methyl-5-hydroxy-6-metoxy-1,4-benzoquinol methylase